MKILVWKTSLPVVAAAVAVAAAACGGPTGEMAVGSGPEEALGGLDHDHGHEEAPSGGGASVDVGLINTVGDVPDLEMIDVSTGATVNLQSFVANEKPLLFWFWVPH